MIGIVVVVVVGRGVGPVTVGLGVGPPAIVVVVVVDGNGVGEPPPATQPMLYASIIPNCSNEMKQERKKECLLREPVELQGASISVLLNARRTRRRCSNGNYFVHVDIDDSRHKKQISTD